MIRHRQREAGFTLLEMMLVISVAAVILGLAVPNFREFMRNNRMSSATNDFMTAVHHARSQAVKLHMPTIVCFTATPDAATPSCDGNGSQGWVAFIDDQDPEVAAATDNNGQVDAGETVFQRHATLNPLTVRIAPAANDAYIAFGQNGFARALPALGIPMEGVVICDDRGAAAARAVTVSEVGRPATTRVADEIAAMGGCL